MVSTFYHLKLFENVPELLIYSGMLRSTDQEMIAIEKIAYYLLTVSERRGHAVSCRATWGSTRISQEAEKARGKHGQNVLLCF